MGSISPENSAAYVSQHSDFSEPMSARDSFASQFDLEDPTQAMSAYARYYFSPLCVMWIHANYPQDHAQTHKTAARNGHQVVSTQVTRLNLIPPTRFAEHLVRQFNRLVVLPFNGLVAHKAQVQSLSTPRRVAAVRYLAEAFYLAMAVGERMVC